MSFDVPRETADPPSPTGVSREILAEIVGSSVSRETFAKLTEFAAFLEQEAAKQNLVAQSTLADLWGRHLLDSAQLVRFAPARDSAWVDIGSGAGLPGLVIALLTKGPVTLVEPRRLRAEFLGRAATRLGLADRVTVRRAKAEAVTGHFDVITARAVAALDRLLAITHHLSHAGTAWVLPKGRNAQSELEQARRSWHCDARAEASATDPESTILVLSRVGKRRR